MPPGSAAVGAALLRRAPKAEHSPEPQQLIATTLGPPQSQPILPPYTAALAMIALSIRKRGLGCHHDCRGESSS
jgi:hypothetical protein